MSNIQVPGPSPFPEEASTPLAKLEQGDGGFDPTFGGTAVLAVLPVGTDAELARRVRQALGTALAGHDDPPPVIVVPEEVDLAAGDEAAEADGGPRRLIGVLRPIVVKLAREVIGHIADEARHQQKMDHAAREAHMRAVEEYHKRSQAWREKTFG